MNEEKRRAEILFSGLALDGDARACTLDGQKIALTPIEFSILWYLCAHRGRVAGVEEIYYAVWGERYLPSCSNTIKVHIRRIRKKLRDPADKPRFIKTVWGVGYRIDR